ncbi:hypothetical protein BpHYR1_050988 [Brachionus plicatilis]|uniref:Uncharacterized protein n=1 Tax=Brachionus plicatilis TaxID=10195 RepID=A0A3M7QXC8_BRAPC|nr:hypothetical protein BpHYR1_050988 [Brachionus plicatilis]
MQDMKLGVLNRTLGKFGKKYLLNSKGYLMIEIIHYLLLTMIFNILFRFNFILNQILVKFEQTGVELLKFSWNACLSLIHDAY